MTYKTQLLRIFKECDIYYKEALISREELIQAYSSFLISLQPYENQRYSLTFHTGSICFDVISILIAAVENALLDKTDTDDILNCLQINDLVIYNDSTSKTGQRCSWGGFLYKTEDSYIEVHNITEASHIFLQQEQHSTKRYVPISAKNLILPYYGSATKTGSKGTRKAQGKRFHFYKTFFPTLSISGVSTSSTVVVASKAKADEILHHTNITYDGENTISLLELITASYFTENDEYPYKGNISKDEPILKFTNKLSVARELILDRRTNPVNALVVNLDCGEILKGQQELIELYSYHSLPQIHVVTDLTSVDSSKLYEISHKNQVFACTPNFLKKFRTQNQSNIYTDIMYSQIEHLSTDNVVRIKLDTNCTWHEYYSAKKALYQLKKHISDTPLHDAFLVEAYSLIKLYTNMAFSMSTYTELCLQKGKMSPKDRILKLEELYADIPNELQSVALIVLDFIKKLSIIPPINKLEAIRKIIASDTHKIAIIVPQAYYINLIQTDLSLRKNISVSTYKQLDKTKQFNEVLIFDNISSKHFNVYCCNNAAKITLIHYDYEEDTQYLKERVSKFHATLENSVAESPYSKEQVEILEESLEMTADLEAYLAQIRHTKFINEIATYTSDGTSSPGEAVVIASCVGGEQILFSKYYKALVYNKLKKTVSEIDVDKLDQGDILIFTQKGGLTRNLVDSLFNTLSESNIFSKEIIKDNENANRWKQILKDYMQENQLSFKDVSDMLSTQGCKRHELTIRSWFNEDYRIIGPREEDTFTHLALLTKNTELKDKSNTFYNACKSVRSKRRELLSLIEKIIINDFTEKQTQNRLFKAIYDNIEHLTITVELDQVTKPAYPLQVQVGMLNKPIHIGG